MLDGSFASSFSDLKRVYHEPKRLALVSALATSRKSSGLSFSQLKEICDLSDGNLNRHLKALEEEGIVTSRRDPTSPRPKKVISLTKSGSEGFARYLVALEEALRVASMTLSGEQLLEEEVSIENSIVEEHYQIL
jgi:DNA-binding transcriptional ArsR family regulator